MRISYMFKPLRMVTVLSTWHPQLSICSSECTCRCYTQPGSSTTTHNLLCHHVHLNDEKCRVRSLNPSI